MLIFVPTETTPGETRAPLVPATVEKLVKLGAQVVIESGLGRSIGEADEAYAKAGAAIRADRAAALSEADVVLRLNRPPVEEARALKPGAIHVSFLDPFNHPELIRALAEAGASAIGMELLPRTTLAQKMDALSSQANLAGYAAVLLAANRLDRIFPMMMTPAGTIAASRVLVIGAGVAGLQAIATARRLGARVEAFDPRPAVEEQVKSLGARFIKIDLGETGETKQGYARALSDEQLRRQREALVRHCSHADVVIAGARVFGQRAPIIVTADMIAAMRPGSVVVDMSADAGGNVEGSRMDEEVLVNGVCILAPGNLPGRVAHHASQMYSSNLGNLIEHFWDREAKRFRLDMEDEILRGALATHDHRVVNELIKQRMG